MAEHVTPPEKKWQERSFIEKLAFVGKACLCLISFGFVYPNLFVE